MAGIINITRNLASSVGNGFASLFGSVFAWFWFAALLITIGVFIIFAPIATIGKGGPGFFQVVTLIAGFLLVGAGVGWAWRRLGEERQRIAMRVGESLGGLVVFAAIIVVAAWSWWSWQVPDVWSRPLVVLTLADIAQNLLKLGILLAGISFVSAVFRELVAQWRRG
jgi:hypothetical protein